MAQGRIDYTHRQEEIETVWMCWQNCDNRGDDQQVLSLFTVRGELIGGYEHEYQQLLAPSRTYVIGDGIGGGWNDTDVDDLPVSDEAADDLAYPVILDVDGEYVVVTSVDRTANTISVSERGYAGTTAAVHADEVVATRIGRALNFCSSDYECEITELGDTVINGRQVIPRCVEYCEDELCNLRRNYTDCGTRIIDQEILVAQRELIRDVENVLIRSKFSSYKDGVPSLRGLEQETLEYGEVYDVSTDPCYGTGGDSTLKLDGGVIDRATRLIEQKGGQANFALMSFNTYKELSDVIQSLPCADDACVEGITIRSAKFLQTPIGNLRVVWHNSVPDDEIIINHTDNLSIVPWCNKPFPFEGTTIVPDPANLKISQWRGEADFTTKYDFTCRDALIITGFVNGQNSCEPVVEEGV